MGTDQRLCAQFRSELGLTGQSTAFLVAVPVLLGSLARLPMGMLTDRFGGRLVFTVLFLLVAVAAAIVPLARDYNTLVAFAFFLGLAGSSFAVGVGFVSRWFPPEKQGTALGVYGLGNMGHSAAVFLGPLLAPRSAGTPSSTRGGAVLRLGSRASSRWRATRRHAQARERSATMVAGAHDGAARVGACPRSTS